MTTVLIVDDEVEITRVLQAILESEGYRVVTAAHGAEGLDRLREEVPDLVLLDVMMPVMDGRELLRAMRSDPAFQAVPVIVTSAARKVPEGAGQAYQAFLEKPYDVETLLEAISRLVAPPALPGGGRGPTVP